MAEGSQNNHRHSGHRSNCNSRRHNAPRYTTAEWEAKEAHYLRELEEARVSACQMEKTMRWWSECTTSWREKWSKVRHERNKIKEEAKELKVKLDAALKDLNAMKSQKTALEQQFVDVKRDNEKLLTIGESRVLSGDLTIEDDKENEIELRKKEYCPLSKGHSSRQRQSLDSKYTSVDVLTNKVSELKLKLDETCRSLKVEKDQKVFLLAKVETLTAELHNAKMDMPHCDRTIGSTGSSQSEVERLQNQLQDEIASKQTLEEQITKLKMDMEKLKSDNTRQWSKREMLETENVAVIRENKRLYSQICDLKEQIHKLSCLAEGAGTSNGKKSSTPRSCDLSSEFSSEPNLVEFGGKHSMDDDEVELAIVERDI